MTSNGELTNDPRLKRILETAEKILARSPELTEVTPETGDELDRLAHSLDAVWNEMARWEVEQIETEERMSEVMSAILNIASLDFSHKIPVTGSGDLFDAVATGLNALGEELVSSVVSHEYLDSIIQSMLDALIVTDEDGIIQTVNQAALRLLNYTESELVGKTLGLVCAGCSDIRDLELATGRQMFLAKGGHKVPVLFSISPLRIASGKMGGYVCAMRDITQQARAEEELRQSEQRLRTVLENMPVMLDAFGPDMTISVWNQECERVTGYSAEEMVGNPAALQLLYPDEEYLQQMMEVWAEIGNDFTNVEWVIVCKDGTRRTISWSNISGRVPIPGWAAWAVGIDVTEQRRAEAALRDSEERYRAIFGQAADSIALIDPLSGSLVEFNNAAHETLGYTREEFAKLKVSDFEVLEDEEAVKIHAQQILEVGVANFETKHRHKDGAILDVLVSSRVIRLKGKQYIQSIWYDISERKQTEAKLRESQYRLAQAQEIGRMGNWNWDIVANDLHWSDQVYRIFGLVPQEFEVTYGRFLQFVHPDDRELVETRIAGALEGKAYDIDHRIVLRDGQVRFVHEQGEITFDDLGKPLRMVGIVQDVTERKVAVAEARAANRLLQAIFDNMHIMLAYLDRDLNFVMVNQAYAEADAKTPDYFPGKGHFDLYPHPENEQIFKRVVETGEAYHVAARPFEYASNPDRGVTHWDWSLEPVKDVGGTVTGVILSVLNVTDRIEAVEALNESEKTLRALLDGTQDVVLLIDTDEQNTIIAANQAYASRFGLTVDECVGLSGAYGLNPELHAARKKHGDQVIETGKPVRFEDFRAGRYMENTIYPIFDDYGKVNRLAIFSHDITERKEAEQAILNMNEMLEQRVIERTAELSAANAEIKQFAYIVSHDLRSPLVNLKGFSAELKESLKDVEDSVRPVIDHLSGEAKCRFETAINEDIPEALGFIESSVVRMDGFTGAILQLSRMGRRELELETLDMNKVVQSSLDMLAYTIEQKGIEFDVHPLPQIRADRVAIEQIISNILNNAINYLDPKRKGKIKVYSSQGDSQTTFYVRDNGRGISQQDMPKVFAPFRRAGRQDVEGEGMGLAYVQTLVRRHGGHIWCESEPGVGSTFIFSIPIQIIQESETSD